MSDDQQFLSKPAIERMRDSGLRVEETAYGFSIRYPLGGIVVTGECGGEHNGSVSISFRGLPSDVDPPVQWFFRFSMREMADLLIAAHNDAQEGAGDWLESLQKLDSPYDHQDLESRLRRRYPDLWEAIDAG